MKKICYIIICLIFTFSFIDVLCASEDIYIKSIEIDSLSSSATEKSNPTFEGNVINFDLEFREVGDYVKYKVIVQNNTDKDYYVKEDTDFSNSSFFSYKYFSESSVKSNSESTLYLVISYDSDVDDDLIVDNKYNESNKAVLELVDDKGIVIKNPKTGNGNFIIIGLIGILIISCLLLFILNRREARGTVFIFIFCLINFIPLLVSADSLLKLELNVNVSIQTDGYYVIYNPGFDGTFVSGSVLKDFDIINNDNDSCKTAYLEGNNYEPDYVWCSNGPLLRSKRMYMPGETVEIVKVNMYSFSNEFNSYMSKCTINEDETSGTCPAFLEYIILLEEEEHSTWVYSEYHITQAGYTYLENDFDVMNFSKLGSYNTVYAYSTFTMPEHDVYFCPDYPV